MGVDAGALFLFQQRGGIPILTLHGEIDWTNAERVRECLSHLETSAASGAIIDLEYVPLALASVFGSIQAFAERMDATRRTLVVVSPPNCFSTQVLRLLRYPYAVADSLDNAVAVLNAKRNTDKAGRQPLNL